MKKLVLTLIVALGFCGLVSAQNYESHWPDFYGPDYDFQTAFVAAFEIDGQIITAEYEGWDALEIAFFVGDECRGAGSDFPDAYPAQYYLYNGYVEEYGDPFPITDGAALYYINGGEEVTVKVYDHLRGIEYTDCVVTYMGEPYTILTGADNDQGWYDPENPIILSFTTPGYELEVTGYGEDNASTNKGYYLIASPVTGAITPTSENHFITDNYDLYYFDQNHELEWVNFKDPENGGWDVVNGKGYLYASQTTTVLTFAGTPNTDGEVTLEYNEGAEFPGLNLVGNPLADDAYIGRGYYRMNRDTREGLVPAGATESIDAMEGIFVIAEEDGETMTFSTTPTFKLRTKLILNLQSSSATLIDRAIVNFENSQELPKIEILNSNSKIYFQKESHDLATLNAGDMGEIPVCFKAVKNGNYTLSFKSEEVTFTYLHLIDNKTGNDVNLLETPYYSFDATTADYESRFRLVFATGSSVDGGNFGFVNSSGNFCIFGIEGEATVQVVDILGHMLSSETFSGSYEKKLNVAPGVYMLRLIQGKDVKVQKTVIK